MDEPHSNASPYCEPALVSRMIMLDDGVVERGGESLIPSSVTEGVTADRSPPWLRERSCSNLAPRQIGPWSYGALRHRLEMRNAGYVATPRLKWWSMLDLNQRPPACEAGALPTELIDRDE